MEIPAKMTKPFVLALLASLIPVAYADQGSFANSGGSGSGGAGVSITSTVTAPAGTLTLNCPVVATGGCTGGSYAFLSNDGSTSISATVTGGDAVESCSGGGKGGHITCTYSLTAYMRGSLTVNNATQAIVGVTSQAFVVDKPPSGTTAYNSAYAPFYY